MAILTLLTALSISAVAIYYSILGLAAIFAGAAIPIMVMGSVLEVGKLVTASWLYQNWKVAPRFIKAYLSIAVVVLMFITSMGIFGFLSKAHVEQTSLGTIGQEKLSTINEKILRSENRIDRWSSDIERLVSGEDVRVDILIDKEQVELDKLYARIDSEKQVLRDQADKDIELQNNRLKQAQERKEADIAAAQERFKGSFSKKGLDEAIAKHGGMSDPIFALMRHTAVYENQSDRDQAINAITRVLGQFENLYRNLDDVKNGFPKEIPLQELEGREQYDPAMLEKNLMFGSPKTVIDKIKIYENLGVNEFIYYASMGLSHEAQKRSLRLFCEEVIPEFQ